MLVLQGGSLGLKVLSLFDGFIYELEMLAVEDLEVILLDLENGAVVSP